MLVLSGVGVVSEVVSAVGWAGVLLVVSKEGTACWEATTSLMEGIALIAGIPGFTKFWEDTFGVSDRLSLRVLVPAVGAVPPPGLFSLLRLPGFFEQIVGVNLHQAQFNG